jgi:hypothetical protein
LRHQVKVIQESVTAAKTELADKLAEVQALENRVRLRIGSLIDRLAELENEVSDFHKEIRVRSSRDVYGSGYLPVEEQFKRTWDTSKRRPDRDEPGPIDPTDKQQVKRLYRQLARRYHPDLSSDQSDLAFRTEKMARLNEAYEAGSLVELVALSDSSTKNISDQSAFENTETEMVLALEKELDRLRRHLLLVQNEIENLHNLPVVQLSLEVKFARRSGRDLLAEMASDLEQRISRKTAERERLIARLNQLDE